MASRKRIPVRDLPEVRRNEDLENLLVFGYNCKLFRDDERAKFIDEGRHLIPWMGDPSLLIDRYDGRGHLHDLRPHDAEHVSRAGHSLSEEERQIEAVCEEERYLELNTDLAERETYEEEEMKRLNEALATESSYAAVGFSYEPPPAPYDPSEPTDQHQGNEDQDAEEEGEEPYIPIPELQVPTTVHAPATMKEHAIIEKTAGFVSQHGGQMEIVIKTKQKDNAQFHFLNYDSELNAYYRHMVAAIKSGRYKPRAQERERNNSEGEGLSYLHPSLSRAVNQVETAASRQEFLSSVSSKLPAGQIANTPYAKLLSNLSKHRRSESPDVSAQTRGTEAPPRIDKPIREEEREQEEPRQSEHFSHYIEESGFPQEDESSLPPLTAPGQPPPPGTVPPAPLPVHGPPGPPGGPLGSAEPPHIHTQDPPQPQPQPQPEQQEEESDDDRPSSPLQPPPDSRPIVDKMADYVARNGPEFEIIVRVKQDERFQFLEKWHPYHAYYQMVKARVLQDLASETADSAASHQEADEDWAPSSGVVSFSIRAREGESGGVQQEKRGTVLPYDESSEEEEDSTAEGGEGSRKSSSSQRPPSDPQQPATSSQIISSMTGSERLSGVEEGGRRQAEERLRDKLAYAARDKLAQASKDKQVKAERKRKAAMFITMLNRATLAASVGSAVLDHTGLDTAMDTNGSPVAKDRSVPASPCPSPRPPEPCYEPLPPAPTSILPPPPPSQHSPPRLPHVPSSTSLHSRSHTPSMSRSRSKSPGWRSKHLKRSPPPSAYHGSKRPKSPVRKKRSRSRSPSGKSKRSRSSRTSHRSSNSRKSRSRSRSRRTKKKSSRRRSRSRSRHRSSKAKSRRSRSRSKSRRSKTHSHRPSSPSKSSRSKRKRRSRSSSQDPKLRRTSSEPKFRAIPEVSLPPVVATTTASHSDLDSPKNSPNNAGERNGSADSSTQDSSEDEAEGGTSREGTANDVALATVSSRSCSPVTQTVSSAQEGSGGDMSRPSNDLLSKVRAMLKASREAVLKEDQLESQLPAAPPMSALPDSDHEEGETDSSS